MANEDERARRKSGAEQEQEAESAARAAEAGPESDGEGTPDAVKRVGRPLHVTRETSDDASELFALERLLVPLDFSPPSDHALGIAIRVARTFGAELTLLHVCEVPAALVSPLPGMAASQGRLSESLHAAAEQEMAARVERVEEAGLTPKSLIVTGVPAAAICETAEGIDADLVVMATRGRGGLAHLLLGSVTERTVHRASCPVLTVRAPRDAAAHGPDGDAT